MDVITRHRLRLLAQGASELDDLDALEALAPGLRRQRLYARFLAATPYENLSNNLRIRASPGDAETWPRTTDNLLRENATQGLGGTSFSLAYALRDLLRGIGENAHCTLGHNLVTEEAHAAVVVYDAEGPWLYDPALLLPGPLPVRPGGELHDELGFACLRPRLGPTLTLCLRMLGETERQVYSIIPIPAPPPCFRQAWIASFHRGRIAPLRIARRLGAEIRRYGERPGRLEVLRPGGRSESSLGPAPAEALSEAFGIARDVLDAWFAGRAGPA